MNADNQQMMMLNNIYAQNSELIYANVFHDTIKGSKWLPSDFSLSPGRFALGYPALYVLYRILDEVRPKSVLELGVGQSTKMISCYNKVVEDCVHYAVDHDKDWLDFFKKNYDLPKTTELINLPIADEDILFSENDKANVTTYEGFIEKFIDKKFELICIDGPYGFRSPRYARIDVIGLLPQCLNERFIIMLDDIDRVGEKNTFDLIQTVLLDAGIKCKSGTYFGEKGTGIIVSEDLGFLCSM